MRQVRILNETEDAAVAATPSEVSESQSVIVSPVDLSKELFQIMQRLKGKFLDGFNKVDYIKLRQTSEFSTFQHETRRLSRVDLTNVANHNERKAFFLNIYNTLTMHALAVSVTREQKMIELDGFWQINGYRIGESFYSLDDIEHGILRCNKKHPSTTEYCFNDEDLRKRFVLPHLDPRIHFALNCGASIVHSENIDKSLQEAAQAFCQNDIGLNVEGKSVTVSKIFLWYGKDFGQDKQAVLAWISGNLREDQARDLRDLMETGDFKLCYGDYNWNII